MYNNDRNCPDPYYLIDFDDCSDLPGNPPETDFTKKEHAPELFNNNQGVEVDYWGIGLLIKTCPAATIPSDEVKANLERLNCPTLSQMGKMLQSPDLKIRIPAKGLETVLSWLQLIHYHEVSCKKDCLSDLSRVWSQIIGKYQTKFW